MLALLTAPACVGSDAFPFGSLDGLCTRHPPVFPDTVSVLTPRVVARPGKKRGVLIDREFSGARLATLCDYGTQISSEAVEAVMATLDEGSAGACAFVAEAEFRAAESGSGLAPERAACTRIVACIATEPSGGHWVTYEASLERLNQRIQMTVYDSLALRFGTHVERAASVFKVLFGAPSARVSVEYADAPSQRDNTTECGVFALVAAAWCGAHPRSPAPFQLEDAADTRKVLAAVVMSAVVAGGVNSPVNPLF